ncbi:PD-(D/E)XK nuclease family protein [Nocardia macrotermitis]|uniref:DNA 3'-5' helicase n=1 Tax=Nocardia macrotermitis TaxID=2585198 RepID=A0A7K0DAT4_9NOCA|nr:PD-(D/E)XK nuclease family protein [Nocardia macrotermitis]MQY22890.1 ATP-dependent DNA helicase Rep [Nocardia macrotermitis]
MRSDGAVRLVRRGETAPRPREWGADVRMLFAGGAGADPGWRPWQVLGGPGTGKTSLLVDIAVDRIVSGADPESILLLTHSKQAALRARNAITRQVAAAVVADVGGVPGAMREPLVRTVHSYAFAIVRMQAEANGNPPPRLLTGAEQDVVLREMLRGELEDIQAGPGGPYGGAMELWPQRLHPALGTLGFAEQLRDLMLRATERGLGPEDLIDLGRLHDRPEWVAAGRFAERYEQAMLLRWSVGIEAPEASAPALDAAELVGAALDAFVLEPGLLDAERSRIHCLLVDDAQHLDPLAAQLVRVIGGGGATAVIAGDPDQAVYTFRGADPQFLTDLETRPERRILLRDNHRAASIIDDVVTRIRGRMPGRSAHRVDSSTEPSLPEENSSDRFDVADFEYEDVAGLGYLESGIDPSTVELTEPNFAVQVLTTPAKEAALIADHLRRAHLTDGVPWSRMAVVVRSVPLSLAPLRRALLAAGVPVLQPKPDVPLARRRGAGWMLLSLRALLAAARERPDLFTEDDALDLLTGPLGGADQISLRRLRRGIRRTILERTRRQDPTDPWAAAGEPRDQSMEMREGPDRGDSPAAPETYPDTSRSAGDSPAPHREAPHREAPHREAPHREVLDREAPDREAPDREAPDREAPDREAPDREAPDREAPDREAPDREAPDREAPDREAPDREAPDREAPDREAPDREAPDREAPDREAPDREALDREALDREAPDREALDREAQDREAPDRDRPSRRGKPLGDSGDLEFDDDTLDSERFADLDRSSAQVLRELITGTGDTAILERLTDVESAPLRRVLTAVRRADKAMRRGAGLEDVLWALWTASRLERRWVGQSERGGAGAMQADRDLDAAVGLFDAAAAYVDRLPRATLEGFVEYLEQQEIPQDSAPPTESGGAVAIVSAHTAAGREWDVVAVAGVQEGIWPNLRPRGTLLGVEDLVDLLAGVGFPGEQLSRSAPILAEERRLLLLACSRARRSLLVTAVESVSGDRDLVPSRFLAELDATAGSGEPGRIPPPVDPGRALVMQALIAELRTVACDPEDTPQRRHRAARQLARLARARVRGAHPDEWYGTADLSSQLPLWGQDEGPVALSPSTVELLSTCPLRWALERHGGNDGENPYAVKGNLVHTLVQALAGHVAEAEVKAALVRAWKAVDPTSDDDGPHSWHSRLDLHRTEEMLDTFLAWLRNTRAELTQLGVEVPVDCVLPARTADEYPVRIRGRVDRVERDALGRFVIVDVKTGKTPISKQAAQDHAQLATYQVAAAAGALDDTGADPQPGGARLVYVAKPSAKEGAAQRLQAALDDESIQQWRDTIHDAAAATRGPSYLAVRNDGCRHCTVAGSCPVQDAGRQVTEE